MPNKRTRRESAAAAQAASAADPTEGEETRAAGGAETAYMTESEVERGGAADDDDSSMDEDEDADVDPAKSEINEGLTELKSTTGKWQTHFYSKKVYDLLQWMKADKRITHRLKVPEGYYQRNAREGWSERQQGNYVAIVFAGRAKTPFVINVIRSEARVMDGGHRIKAIQNFLDNKVGMVVTTSDAKIFYKDMHKEDKKHFMDQQLQFLEYKNLPLHDEISEYLSLNSGLPFTTGEKLGAMKQINYCVFVAFKLKDDPFILPFLRILTPDSKVFRMNDLVVATFLTYNLWFRHEPSAQSPSNLPPPMAIALGAEFCNTISAFKIKDTTIKNDRNRTVADGVQAVRDRAEAALRLYAALTDDAPASAARQRTGQTPFRRMLICMLAVTEIPDLDHAVFRAFVEATDKSPSILRDRSCLDAAAIERCRTAYEQYVAAAGVAAG